MKKRIFSIILITILLIVYTLPVCAAQPPGTGLPGTSVYDNLFFKNTININTEDAETYYFFLGTEETYAQASDVRVYPIYSDNSAYLSYEEKRIIGFFFLSSSDLSSIGITCARKDETGQYVKPINYSFSISNKLPDYKSLTIYDSYWSSYLAQFGIDTDEEYTQFYEEYSGYYYGIYDLSSGYKKNSYLRESVNESGEMIIHPLNADGSKYDDTSISTLTSSSFNLVSTGSHYYFPPFLFTGLMSDEDGDGNGNGNGSGSDDGNGNDSGNPDNFICYVNVTQVFYKLSSRNKMRFYWDVSKYPQFKNGFIELRAFPYNEAAKINEVDDAYWFSSLTLSNKKENQKYFSLGNFDDGEYIAIDYYLDDYYHNFLEKISEIVAPYNSGNYRFQLRVCDSEKNVRTNWITFDLDDMQREYSSSILDPNGNVVDDNVYDNEDFDSDFRDNGQTSDIYDKNDPNNNRLNDITEIDGMKFQTWLNSAYSNVKDFASLLNYFYGWLPAELIYSIGVSIIIIITLRILGR